MSKSLVAYFSASGVTRKVAEKLAKVTESDLFEIEPSVKYTKEDLNWMDKNSRSSIEMADKSYRPEIKNKIENIAEYDIIYLGFPIWWYIAPTIINTFLESYDFSGKKIAVFATSGGSSLGNTINELKPSAKNAEFIFGTRFDNSVSEQELQVWADGLNI